MIVTPLLLWALLPALAKPMPAPDDQAAQERATACIFYLRLQLQSVPGGSAACEADGYGLEFMALHAEEVAALERAHQAQLDAQLARAHAVAAAMRDRDALTAPCTAMILDGGPGPDGGAALCDMAGLTHDVVTRIARHDAFVAQEKRGIWIRRVGPGVGLLLIVIVLGIANRLRRLRPAPPRR
jgi:hypothetical protein